MATEKEHYDSEPRTAQRNLAIERANAARKAKKALRMAVKANLIEDLELVRGNLAEYEPLIVKWPVDRLLLLCRDIGPARCDEVLAAMKLSPRKKVGAPRPSSAARRLPASSVRRASGRGCRVLLGRGDQRRVDAGAGRAAG